LFIKVMEPSKKLKPGVLIEMGLLLLATPFLLFPTVFPVGTALALVVVGLIWLGEGWSTGRFLPFTPFNLPLFFWLLAVLVGTLVSADPELTLPKLTGLILGVTIWRTLVVRVYTKFQLVTAVLFFLLAAAVMMIVGGLSLDWRAKLPFISPLVTRLPQAWFSLPESNPGGVQANQLAGTLMLVWPLSLSLMLWGWPGQPDQTPILRQFGRIIVLILAVGGAVLLLLTQSRTGWVGGLAGVSGLFWLKWARQQPWSRVRIGLIIAVVGAVFLMGMMPLIQRWVMTQATPGTTSSLETMAYRFEVWHYAIEAITNFPLTGTGLGTFRQVVLRLYPITVFPHPDVSHAHNVFLQIALDTGLPGLVAYLALLSLTLVVGWRWVRQSPAHEGGIAVGVLVCILAFHLFGLGDTIAPGAKPGLLFWWLIGLVSVSVRVIPEPASQITHSILPDV
jgi:putative inorganic carbon (HCO3(-)) transporter